MSATLRSKSLAAGLLGVLVCTGLAAFKAQSSVSVTPTDESEAQQAIEHAEKVRGSWTKASLQEAIEQYMRRQRFFGHPLLTLRALHERP